MEERVNILEEKSYRFAINVVNLYKKLVREEKEFVLSRQFLKCGTSIGADLAEANGAISTADFSAKISIAYKESLENEYWARLLKDTDYISAEDFTKTFGQADELSRILFAILKKARINK